jgi:ribose transport system ATP-binding protein
MAELGSSASTDGRAAPGAARPSDEILLRMQGISKRFPGVQALDGVDFDLRRGEVHVLFGENGAGKSTLINVIAGTFPPDAGTIEYKCRTIAHLTPHQARAMGISPVFQEFSLVPELTVEQNLFLGREIAATGLLRKRAMRRRAQAVIEELGFDLEPGAKVRELSRAHQQMVEIAKALLANVQLLILDEPTASLTEAETAKLFALIERLRETGVGIIYVSHRMREIKRVADRITVLRDGRKIRTVDSRKVGEGELVEMMTGRKIEVLFPDVKHRPAETVLEVEHLTLKSSIVQDVSLRVRAGEIVGIAGLVGCGKSELVRALYGLESIESGRISIFGRPVERPTPARLLRAGVCYFPSDRVAEGLALTRPVRENASMAALDLPAFASGQILQRRSEKSTIQSIVDRLRLRPPQIERMVGNLSGGNRQKVVLARGLTRQTRIFLFDEPTVGIDVGAKVEVYDLMRNLVEAGAAIVLVSSELPEVLHLSNRLYVMHRSRLVAELAGADINEPAVLSCFFQDEGAAPRHGDGAPTGDTAAPPMTAARG